MKLLASILTLSILVLLVIPCHDLPQNNILLRVTEIALDTGTNNAPQDMDFCSPFCVCQCCQSNVLVTIPPIHYASAGVTVSFNPYSTSIQYIEIFDFLIPPKS